LSNSLSHPTQILARQIFPAPPEVILRAIGETPSLDPTGELAVRWLDVPAKLLLTIEDELDRLLAAKATANGF
jgi:hypothetical protein